MRLRNNARFSAHRDDMLLGFQAGKSPWAECSRARDDGMSDRTVTNKTQVTTQQVVKTNRRKCGTLELS